MSKLMLLALMLGQLSCSDGKCPNAPRGVEWRSRIEEPGRVYLFVAGRQLGGYDGTLDEWRDLLVSSMGFNPLAHTERQKTVLLTRILPCIEPRVNLVELAPKGTGKSFVYDNLLMYSCRHRYHRRVYCDLSYLSYRAE